MILKCESILTVDIVLPSSSAVLLSFHKEHRCSSSSPFLHSSDTCSQSNILYYKVKSLCIYLFVCLLVCTFALSSVLLTNRLTQALKIRIYYCVNFFWSSKHIFNFLRFVIQKLRVS